MAAPTSSRINIRHAHLRIGMEIHVELATQSKMFSRSPNPAHVDHYDQSPNTLIDPLVLGLPGALPVMNRRAVEMSMMVGLALGCSISPYSRWDRKNYFYPDLPKGYQISQYDLALCEDGALDIPLPSGENKRIGIIRAHLEEDTGKLSHELPGGEQFDGSLVDLNRAGTPLLEIVTQPDLSSAEEAVTFAKELRNICRFLGVTGGVMQRGQMRFEPNVNVIIIADDGREFATPIVEIKNLNSFRAVKSAIEFEHQRQINTWQETALTLASGNKSTRGWDEVRQVTVLQREKEEAHDYRYFPDPDLPPVEVSNEWRERLAASMSELPMARRARYMDEYELRPIEAQLLTDDFEICAFFEACIAALLARRGDSITSAAAGRACANLLLNTASKRANDRDQLISELGISPERIAQIIELRETGVIGSTAADELFGLLCETDADAVDIAKQNGLIQINDTAQLERWIDQAIAAQEQAARDFADGKDAALGRLVGAVMKASAGQADAHAVQDLLRSRLRDK